MRTNIRSFALRNAKIVVLLWAGCLVVTTGKSQNDPKQFTGELNLAFQGSESKKIEKSIDLLNQADALIEKAENQFSALTDVEKKERASDAYEAAIKTLFAGSAMHREAHSLVFSVFKEKNKSFWQKMEKTNHRASGMDKARYYEGTAQKTMNRSLIRREQVMEGDRFEYALSIMKDAYNLEKLAIRDQGRAMQICADYPVEYNYGWENDLTLDQILAILKDPIVHEPPADIFATVDQSANVDSSLFKEIIFKVQVAAHNMPLTDEYLNSLYRGELAMDMIYEDEWYKYSIGRYATFEEADATLKATNIKKAFVVAYREGKKINIQEARQEAEQAVKQ
jgi:hypothetical protein